MNKDVEMYLKPAKMFQPFLRFWMMQKSSIEKVEEIIVSTLLEILGLVCLVVVGF